MFAAHAERYSRIKNDPDLNYAILNEAFLASGQEGITGIAYHEKPLLKHVREIYSGESSILSKPFNPKKYISEFCSGFFSKLEIKTFYHHESHAAAFQLMNISKAIVVVVDAIGEFDTFSFWYASYSSTGKAQYKKIHSIKYPHSLGLLYSAFTEYVGLKPDEEEYIMMGMAAYGDKFALLSPDMYVSKRFNENNPKFNFELIQNVHAGLPMDKTTVQKEDFAASIQAYTEETLKNVFKYAQKLAKIYNLNDIVYSGGVAMNCVANTKIAQQPFNLHIAPNPMDSGSALGAASLLHQKKVNFKNLYLGTNIPGPYPIKQAISELNKTGIVGIANGKAEFGARALGNRSLLADPRDPEIKDKVNDIKKRQKFRPFAPVVLPKYADRLFIIPSNKDMSMIDCSMMQYAVQATPECQELYPSIIHKDGTARIQIAEQGTGIYNLLTEFYLWSNECPMLLNTSLNIRSEPIVNTKDDATRFEKKYKTRVV